MELPWPICGRFCCTWCMLFAVAALLLIGGCGRSAHNPAGTAAPSMPAVIDGEPAHRTVTSPTPCLAATDADDATSLVSQGECNAPRSAVAPAVQPTGFITISKMLELGDANADPTATSTKAYWEFPSAAANGAGPVQPQPLPEVGDEPAPQAFIAQVDSDLIAPKSTLSRPQLLSPRRTGAMGDAPDNGPRLGTLEQAPTVTAASPDPQSAESLIGELPAVGINPGMQGIREDHARDRRYERQTSADAGAGTSETSAPRSDHPRQRSRAVQTLIAQSTPAATGSMSGDRVNGRAIEKLKKSNDLAARGALFAARVELHDVLSMIAAAKDAIHGTSRRARALAAGLHALDEAEDFVQSTATGDADHVAAAHQTPLGRRGDLSGLSPSQAADVYLRFAQLNLGAAVAGEPAGSAALHALGKLYSRMQLREQASGSLTRRRAFACQQAALLARNDNYLAAHELGVLLAESGHFQDAERMLRQVAAHRADPVVYRNLAHVHRLLGQAAIAQRLDEQAVQLAQSGGPNDNVRLVSPAQFVAVGDTTPDNRTATATDAARSGSADAARAAAPATNAASPWYLR